MSNAAPINIQSAKKPLNGATDFSWLWGKMRSRRPKVRDSQSADYLSSPYSARMPGAGTSPFSATYLDCPVQAKLTVSVPGDKYEQEADQVADRVMRMSDPELSSNATSVFVLSRDHSEPDTLMRQPASRNTSEDLEPEEQRAVLRLVCPECEELLQAKEASTTGIRPTAAFRSHVESTRAGGDPLPGSVRSIFEPRFGYDFSNVRIHTDVRAGYTAKRMNALAYTMGPHITFAPGQFNPYSHEGQHLLAHELTHVVQQSAASREKKATVSAMNHVGTRELRRFDRSVDSSITINRHADASDILRHTAADCDRWYDQCCDVCRSLPNRTKSDKARRALCWARCATEYGACLASTDEAIAGTLTGLAIVAAVVLAAADGPLPIGDAAAVGLLGLVGINVLD
jgi:hypothetical protein